MIHGGWRFNDQLPGRRWTDLPVRAEAPGSISLPGKPASSPALLVLDPLETAGGGRVEVVQIVRAAVAEPDFAARGTPRTADAHRGIHRDVDGRDSR